MDAKDRYVVEGIALSTSPEDVGEGIQSPENDTNSLQSLSYLDPPVDSVYMICGVLIAMVLVGVIIVLLAVTISKLRKREEHSHHHHHHHHHHHGNTVHPEQVQQCCSGVSSQQQQQQQQQQREEAIRCDGDGGIVNPAMTGSTMTVDSCCAVATQSATSTIVAALGNGCTERTSPESGYGGTATTTANAEQFIWQFPPPYPPPNTPPPQYTLYNDQDTLVHGLQSDRQGFAKGFRKNLGGRWRRLVKRKPETETCAIPPELKDQLKTIYVY
ncbi:PREDICTED: uncharacterized protein LOC105362377 [Ceratosolen solmsi marchali]|uniref:Uncharacterized protein LOC105362377 n=1 Tax=Ceratosolen solmsi marchali TaxID=326594 RepID=A0AAJ7DVN9_9HYME|nr:PREDICTED: uncharacterized protein LOC105362377 [Ceratosolen solmsi marchali]